MPRTAVRVVRAANPHEFVRDPMRSNRRLQPPQACGRDKPARRSGDRPTGAQAAVPRRTQLPAPARDALIGVPIGYTSHGIRHPTRCLVPSVQSRTRRESHRRWFATSPRGIPSRHSTRRIAATLRLQGQPHHVRRAVRAIRADSQVDCPSESNSTSASGSSASLSSKVYSKSSVSVWVTSKPSRCRSQELIAARTL